MSRIKYNTCQWILKLLSVPWLISFHTDFFLSFFLLNIFYYVILSNLQLNLNNQYKLNFHTN